MDVRRHARTNKSDYPKKTKNTKMGCYSRNRLETDVILLLDISGRPGYEDREVLVQWHGSPSNPRTGRSSLANCRRRDAHFISLAHLCNRTSE